MTGDAFAALTGLIALVTDAKACARRVAELQATIAAAETAQAQLEAARIANERAFAETKSDLDRRAARLVEGEVGLRLRVDGFNLREARREADHPSVDRFPQDANLIPGSRSHSGLAREAYRDE